MPGGPVQDREDGQEVVDGVNPTEVMGPAFGACERI